MEIRPKKFIYESNRNAINQLNNGYSGVGTKPLDNIWYKYVHSSGGDNSQMNYILQMLAKYGSDTRYGDFLNKMQENHRLIYREAENSGDWRNKAYKSLTTEEYQKAYKGNSLYNAINVIENSDLFDYNTKGITNAYNAGIFIKPGYRTSGDNPDKSYNVDGLYSSITDLRRLLGREGDWDENSQEFKDWLSALNKLGWETYKDDGYYFLRRLNDNTKLGNVTGETMDLKSIEPLNIGEYNRQQALKRLEKDLVTSKIIGNGKQDPPVKTSWWDKLSKTLSQYGPDILEAGRLAGNLRNNQLVYEAVKKGIVPNLRDSYHTYAQVKGDEGTKLAYYRRAVQGEAQAAKPFVSDADKTIAYRNEAKRIGDEGRAQGDLADNAEIRRTSDISDLHAWTNVARDNEVAGYNSAELNRVKGILANLDAQKLSADWTNWDTYLTGREYRWRDKLNEYRAAIRLKNQIQYQSAIDNDPELARINKEIWEHYKSNGNVIDDRIKELLKLQRQRLRDLELKWFDPIVLGKDHVELAKNGTTIKHKKKEDLLYKQVKDTVEHFRKMVKMSDDSRIKSSKKDNKRLILPPKTRKMQLGGIAPFTFFKPVALGGETSTQVSSTGSSSSNSSSSKSGGSGKDEKLEFIKKLYLDMIGAGKGIPIDVSLVAGSINKSLEAASLLGGEISTDLLASMYLSAALKLNLLAYSQQILTNAEKVATLNGALDEYAVTVDGKYIVQDEKGILKKVGLEQIKQGGLNPLTNNQLLFLRNHTPQMALQNGDQIMQEVVANSIGMSKINDEILKMVSNLGTDEIVKEGYTKQQAGEIKRGLELLLEAPAGDYKYTLTDKNLLRQANLAQKFILRGLPKNYKAVLEINALENKMTPELYVGAIIGSRMSNTQHLEFDAVTGKAAKDANGNSKGDNLEINYALKLLTGIGEPLLESFGIGNNNSFLAYGRSSIIATTGANEEAFGADFSYNELYKSGVGKILNLDNASFGDVPINKAMKDSIIVDNSKIVGVDLPYTRTSSGRIIPNFKMLAEIEKADKEAMELNLNPENPADINKINLIYAQHKLPIKYKGVNLLSDNYMRFAVIQATASEDAFLNKEGLSSNKTLTLVSDEQEIDKYVRLMAEITKNKKYSLDRPGIFSFGNKDVYKGSIFIPITGDITDATLAGGSSKMTTGVSTNLEILRDKWHTRNYVAPPEINISK